MLDFYFSSHPLAQYEKDLRRFSIAHHRRPEGPAGRQEITIGGMLSRYGCGKANAAAPSRPSPSRISPARSKA